jgi:hypothetical protein
LLTTFAPDLALVLVAVAALLRLPITLRVVRWVSRFRIHSQRS